MWGPAWGGEWASCCHPRSSDGDGGLGDIAAGTPSPSPASPSRGLDDIMSENESECVVVSSRSAARRLHIIIIILCIIIIIIIIRWGGVGCLSGSKQSLLIL